MAIFDGRLQLLLTIFSVAAAAIYAQNVPYAKEVDSRGGTSSCDCLRWTNWISADTPSDSGDWETLGAPDEYGRPGTIHHVRPDICTVPVRMECRTVEDKTPWYQTGQKISYECNSQGKGFACLNKKQAVKDSSSYGEGYKAPAGVSQDYAYGDKCRDYEVRVLCFYTGGYDCNCLYWTKWYNNDNPTTGNGDEELIGYSIPKYVCEGNYEPVDVQCKTVAGLDVFHAGNKNIQCDLRGLTCYNGQQGKNCKCHDYEVRFLCPRFSANYPVSAYGTGYDKGPGKEYSAGDKVDEYESTSVDEGGDISAIIAGDYSKASAGGGGYKEVRPVYGGAGRRPGYEEGYSGGLEFGDLSKDIELEIGGAGYGREKYSGGGYEGGEKYGGAGYEGGEKYGAVYKDGEKYGVGYEGGEKYGAPYEGREKYGGGAHEGGDKYGAGYKDGGKYGAAGYEGSEKYGAGYEGGEKYGGGDYEGGEKYRGAGYQGGEKYGAGYKDGEKYGAGYESGKTYGGAGYEGGEKYGGGGYEGSEKYGAGYESGKKYDGAGGRESGSVYKYGGRPGYGGGKEDDRSNVLTGDYSKSGGGGYVEEGYGSDNYEAPVYNMGEDETPSSYKLGEGYDGTGVGPLDVDYSDGGAYSEGGSTYEGSYKGSDYAQSGKTPEGDSNYYETSSDYKIGGIRTKQRYKEGIQAASVNYKADYALEAKKDYGGAPVDANYNVEGGGGGYGAAVKESTGGAAYNVPEFYETKDVYDDKSGYNGNYN